MALHLSFFTLTLWHLFAQKPTGILPRALLKSLLIFGWGEHGPWTSLRGSFSSCWLLHCIPASCVNSTVVIAWEERGYVWRVLDVRGMNERSSGDRSESRQWLCGCCCVWNAYISARERKYVKSTQLRKLHLFLFAFICSYCSPQGLLTRHCLHPAVHIPSKFSMSFFYMLSFTLVEVKYVLHFWGPQKHFLNSLLLNEFCMTCFWHLFFKAYAHVASAVFGSVFKTDFVLSLSQGMEWITLGIAFVKRKIKQAGRGNRSAAMTRIVRRLVELVQTSLARQIFGLGGFCHALIWGKETWVVEQRKR